MALDLFEARSSCHHRINCLRNLLTRSKTRLLLGIRMLRCLLHDAGIRTIRRATVGKPIAGLPIAITRCRQCPADRFLPTGLHGHDVDVIYLFNLHCCTRCSPRRRQSFAKLESLKRRNHWLRPRSMIHDPQIVVAGDSCDLISRVFRNKGLVC